MALGIEEDVELREGARQGYVVGEPKPRSFVSGPVAGELLLVLLDRFPQRVDAAMATLARFVRQDKYIELGAHGRPGDGAFGVAADLIHKDGLLEPTDALVAACALVDRASSGLVTTDQDLLLSEVVIEAFDARNKRLIEFDVGHPKPPRVGPRRRR